MVGTTDTDLIREVSVIQSALDREVPLYILYVQVMCRAAPVLYTSVLHLWLCCVRYQDMAVASGPEAAVVEEVEEEEEVGLGEPSSSEDAPGKKKKKKKKKKELKGVQENGDCMFEEEEEVLDKEAALSKGRHWKEKKQPKRAKGSVSTTGGTRVVSEEVRRGGRKRQASSRRADLPQAEGMMEDEISEQPKTKISPPEEFEADDSGGLFADLSTGDWGSSNGGEGESEMAVEAAMTPTALVHRKSEGTRRLKKGKVKHVKTHKAGRVASLAAARTSDSIGMDWSEIAEEGGNGGRDGARRSVSPSKHVSFKPQQLYTVQGVCGVCVRCVNLCCTVAPV